VIGQEEELERGLLGQRQRFASSRSRQVPAIFPLKGVVTRAKLGATSDMSRLDGEVLSIDVD
jgi:hypothetical protein